MRRVLLCALAEDVDVPLGVRLGAICEGHVEADVVVLADRADRVVLGLRELDLLEVRDNADCENDQKCQDSRSAVIHNQRYAPS